MAISRSKTFFSFMFLSCFRSNITLEESFEGIYLTLSLLSSNLQTKKVRKDSRVFNRPYAANYILLQNKFFCQPHTLLHSILNQSDNTICYCSSFLTQNLKNQIFIKASFNLAVRRIICKKKCKKKMSFPHSLC